MSPTYVCDKPKMRTSLITHASAGTGVESSETAGDGGMLYAHVPPPPLPDAGIAAPGPDTANVACARASDALSVASSGTATHNRRESRANISNLLERAAPHER